MAQDIQATGIKPTGEGDAVLTAFAERGFYVSETKGVSMRPLFHTHDSTVFILPLTGEAKKYDAVLYPGKNGYILHRVIGVGDAVYRIRGDNTYRTEYVPKERVVGILTEFVRRGKHHTTEERPYRLYVRVWTAIYPLRYVICTGSRFCYRVLRRLFRRKRK